MQSSPLPNDNNMPSKSQLPQHHSKIKPHLRKYYQKNDFESQAKELKKSHTRTGKQFKFYGGHLQKDRVKVSRHAREILQIQDQPEALDYALDDQWKFQNVYFAAQLKKNSHTLSSLCLHTTERENAHNFNAVLKSVTSLKNLNQMEFKLYIEREQILKLLFRFFQSLKYFRDLTDLSFRLSKMDGKPISNEVNIFSHLPKLTKLRYLRVEIHSDLDSDSENLLNMLSSALPKLSYLSQIELILPKRAIQAPTLIQLFRSFFAAKNLSHITLDPKSFDITILVECLASLDPCKIKKLDLNLNFLEKSQILGKLSQALKRFSSLEILGLKFEILGQIAQEDIEEFKSALSSFGSLSSLSLKSSSDFVIESVGSALKSLKNLKLFKLESRIFFTKDEIIELFVNLKGLSCLEFLDLSLQSQQNFDDSVCVTLARSLKGLVSLKGIFLTFPFNPRVTNIGVKSICQAIKGLPNLSSLILDFALNGKITEEAVNEVFEALRTLALLYDVVICFDKCYQLYHRAGFLRESFEALRKAGKFVEGKLDVSGGIETGLEGLFLAEQDDSDFY